MVTSWPEPGVWQLNEISNDSLYLSVRGSRARSERAHSAQAADALQTPTANAEHRTPPGRADTGQTANRIVDKNRGKCKFSVVRCLENTNVEVCLQETM